MPWASNHLYPVLGPSSYWTSKGIELPAIKTLGSSRCVFGKVIGSLPDGFTSPNRMLAMAAELSENVWSCPLLWSHSRRG
jgi:hypothetical protein